MKEDHTKAISVEVVDTAGLAHMLGVTPKTIRKMDRRGALPSPLAIGSRKKWRIVELRAWLAAGAPCRNRWESMRSKSMRS